MSEKIFVTGASGFLGSHIVIQLLNKGYHVRAAARGTKVQELTKSYAKFGERFEAVAISDISTDQFPDALKGIDAVIHSAAPLAERQAPEAILKGAVEGTLNIIRQAEKAGIKRLVVTSSIVSVMNPRNSFTDQDWYPIEKENALDGSSMDTYRAAKTFAEKELWAFGDAHPDLDITTLNPPFLYGPFAEGFTLPTPNYYALSTNLYIYRLLTSAGTFPTSPAHADVRDVATAHVLALTSPPASSVSRKRILFASPYGFNFKAVVDLIREKRPELKDRLIKASAPEFPVDKLPIDFGRIEQVLGFGKDDFSAVEDTMLSAVDGLLTIERQWASQGHEVSIPAA